MGPDGALWFAEFSGNRIGRIAASSQGVPTLSQWGMFLIAGLLAGSGAFALHRRSRRPA